MKQIPKPPEYRKWRMNKRVTWDACILHPSDEFYVRELDMDISTIARGMAMSGFCEKGYFSKHRPTAKYMRHDSTWIYVAKSPFTAYKDEYHREQ